MTISKYKMDRISVGDILLYNDDPKIENSGSVFRSNTPPDTRQSDRFECVTPPLSLGVYGNSWAGYSQIMYVKNLRTGAVSSCFWWRLKQETVEVLYDPTQMGDKEDDI